MTLVKIEQKLSTFELFPAFPLESKKRLNMSTTLPGCYLSNSNTYLSIPNLLRIIRLLLTEIFTQSLNKRVGHLIMLMCNYHLFLCTSGDGGRVSSCNGKYFCVCYNTSNVMVSIPSNVYMFCFILLLCCTVTGSHLDCS